MTLTRFLKLSGEKPREFAARAGISQPYISRLLRGERFPRPEMIDKIAMATSQKVTARDWFAARGKAALPGTAEAAA